MKSFIFEHEFSGKSLKIVSQSILDWLESEGGKVVNRDDPHHIVAVHGKGWILVWERSAKKKMDFKLEEISNGIRVLVQVTPSKVYFDDVPRYEGAIAESWSRLLNEVWATIEGGELAREYLKPLDVLEEEVRAKRESSKHSIAIGLALMGLGVLLIYGFIQLFGYQDHYKARILATTLDIPIALGTIKALLGVFDYALSRNEINRIEGREIGKQT